MGPIILISTFAILLTIIPMSNLLDTCLVGCICNDTELFVKCEKSKLDVIPITFNPYVTNLILNNNNIKSIESSSFEFYDDLKRLDLSTNMISSLPNNSFKKQKNLTELYLNRNKIAKIDQHAFGGLRKLSTLSLRNNLVDTIGEFTFKELTNLITLNLGENRISEIDKKAFFNLKNLSVLYLDDNLLSSISNLPIQNLKNLAELYIGRNNFKTLQKDSFFGLSHLLRLDLSGSAIFHLNDGVFNDLASLRILNLIDNKLDSIPTSQLSNLSRLEELYLGQNNFRIIRKDAFKGLDSLRKLEITGSIYLERIETEAFSTNLNLEVLILKDNRALKVIEDGILIGFPKLKHVEFHNNALESLSESVMSWSDIKYLDLSNNPLLCDCNLLWLSRHLVGRNMSTVQCSLPFSLKDLPLKSLSANDLGCSFTDPHQQMFFAVMFFFAIVFLAGVGVYLYRYRQSVREALKEHKWNKRAMNRKEHEYQKTFSSDDDYILRTAIQHQNHLHSQSQTLSIHHPHHLHHHNHHLQNLNHSQQYLNHTLSYHNTNQTPNQNQYYSPYHHQQLLHNQSKSVTVPISNSNLSPHAKPIPVTEL